MDQGDFIRHRAKPEWGIGQVLLRTEDRIDVQFPHGLVLLKLSIAGPHIERVSASQAAAARTVPAARRQGPASTASAPRRVSRARRIAEAESPDD
jgi:hypothetical protein